MLRSQWLLFSSEPELYLLQSCWRLGIHYFTLPPSSSSVNLVSFHDQNLYIIPICVNKLVIMAGELDYPSEKPCMHSPPIQPAISEL
jgi:hypothetical protein